MFSKQNFAGTSPDNVTSKDFNSKGLASFFPDETSYLWC